MLCSECSKPVRPVLAVDIDGTLGAWHRQWFIFADGYFGREFDHNYTGATSLADHMGITKEKYRDAKLAFRQGGYKRTMPRYNDTDQFIKWLKGKQLEVWITTTRPYLRLDNLDPDTREWLDRVEMPYDGLLYDDDKYKALVDRVEPERVLAVLEDEPECYDRAEELGLHPILVARSHNRSTHRPVTAEAGLGQAIPIINERIQRWENRNAHG